MSLLLGIDTGGTYTDAVLFDEQKGVLRSAKALTTKQNLSIGIRQALEQVLAGEPVDISLVSLSTTLATNAIVEGQGYPVGLLLIGYPPDALKLAGLGEVVGQDPVVFLPGGHTVSGDEQEALDIGQGSAAILAMAPKVSAYAISGYFSVLNPSHEIALRDIARQLTGLPVTCGHELTSNLHAPRRALTTLLNARLIPLLQQLILAVQGLLKEKGIQAPLMVVKGDGSLMNAQMALERPVETILSGPAASVVGAKRLSNENDVFVADMGGTTTDIAVLRNGFPVLNRDGAAVNGWQTMVEAISIQTHGLGGDSEVWLDKSSEMKLGPKRVMPLSLLALDFPEVIKLLRSRLDEPHLHPAAGQFVVRQRSLESGGEALDDEAYEVWTSLEKGSLSAGVMPLDEMIGVGFQSFSRKRGLERLVERGLVVLAGFTPSDAAHVLGYQKSWSVEAARLGAELWAGRVKKARGLALFEAEEFCEQVFLHLKTALGMAVVGAALDPADRVDLQQDSPMRRTFVDRALRPQPADGDRPMLKVAIQLACPLVAIGAPVQTYFPSVAERLHTRLCIPPYAEVANAVGAVVGSVMQVARARIKPLQDESGFRVHLPDGIQDFESLEAAAAFAAMNVQRMAQEMAQRAGAKEISVRVDREDHIFQSENGGSQSIYLDTEISGTAVGRPSFTSG